MGQFFGAVFWRCLVEPLRGPAVRTLSPSNGSPAQMARTAATAYSADLASIHDAGFGHVASNAAVELLKHLRKSRRRPMTGLVIDVGCGSGILSQAVSAAGYDVLGFDYSEAMLAIARKRAPRAEFRRESFISAAVPSCIAIAAVGEVFNYLFDRRNRASRLPRVLRNLYQAPRARRSVALRRGHSGPRSGIGSRAWLFGRSGLDGALYGRRRPPPNDADAYNHQLLEDRGLVPPQPRDSPLASLSPQLGAAGAARDRLPGPSAKRLRSVPLSAWMGWFCGHETAPVMRRSISIASGGWGRTLWFAPRAPGTRGLLRSILAARRPAGFGELRRRLHPPNTLENVVAER